MLTIKDISASKELDRAAMTEVRGGDATILSTNAQSSAQLGFGGLVNVNESAQNQFASNIAQDNDFKYEQITNVLLGAGNAALVGGR